MTGCIKQAKSPAKAGLFELETVPYYLSVTVRMALERAIAPVPFKGTPATLVTLKIT